MDDYKEVLFCRVCDKEIRTCELCQECADRMNNDCFDYCDNAGRDLKRD